MSSERNTRIRRTQISDVAPKDVNAYAINEYADGYVPSYNEASGRWEWVSNAGGVSTLSGLNDVDFDSGTPTDNQVLQYDSETDKWKAGDITSESIDNLSDADGDTKIQVEESEDEDIIRIDIAGTEVGLIDSDKFRFKNEMRADKNIYFNEEYNNGNSGSEKTIDWSLGNKQKITLTEDATINFTNPNGACSLVLKVIQDATGNRSVNWDSDIKWAQGSEPNLTDSGNAIDLISFYFDGTYYYGMIGFDFN